MTPALTYVVTGASRGLGFEFVRQLAANGNTVFALVRNPDSSEKLKKLVNNKTVYAIKMDANDEDSIKVTSSWLNIVTDTNTV